MPAWLVPNTITLTSLVNMLLPTLLPVACCLTATKEVPLGGWIVGSVAWLPRRRRIPPLAAQPLGIPHLARSPLSQLQGGQGQEEEEEEEGKLSAPLPDPFKKHSQS